MKTQIPKLTSEQKAQILGDAVPQPASDVEAGATNPLAGLHTLCAYSPRGLISLRDMIEFLGYDFISLLSDLEREGRVAGEIVKQGCPAAAANQEYVVRMCKLLGGLRDHCGRLCLTASVASIQHFIEYTLLGHFPDPTFQVIESQISGLYSSILTELHGCKFTFIPANQIQFFEQPALLGPDVHAVVGPLANAEIKAAGNCLAVGLDDAAVFHLMRVAEYGLRYLAIRLRVISRLRHPLQLSEWGQVIGKIRCVLSERQLKLQKKQQKTRTLKRTEALEYYSGLINTLEYFKEAYRNPNAHLRGHYSSKKAGVALDEVRHLMSRIVKGVDKKTLAKSDHFPHITP